MPDNSKEELIAQTAKAEAAEAAAEDEAQELAADEAAADAAATSEIGSAAAETESLQEAANNGSSTDASPKKKVPRSMKILIGIVIAIVAIIVIAVIAFIIYMRSTYSQFYGNAEAEFDIPGVNEGFIPQDMDYASPYDAWIFSGYMNDDTASPIYRRTSDGSVSRVFVNRPDGEGYRGHGGGITSDMEHVLITDGSGYLVIDMADLMNAEAGEFVDASAYVPIEFTPAFIDIFGGMLYAGNFYDGNGFDSPEKMHINRLDGEQNGAVMYAYPEDETSPSGWSTIPDEVYSIPDKVQGVCAVSNGDFVFSTSWALNASHLLVYKHPKSDIGTYPYSIESLMPDGQKDDNLGLTTPEEAEEAEEINDEEPATDFVDVPLYVFSSTDLRKDIVTIPMSEGIKLHDGRVYICNESASNKYFFGKLIGGQVCYSLDISQYPNVDTVSAE